MCLECGMCKDSIMECLSSLEGAEDIRDVSGKNGRNI